MHRRSIYVIFDFHSLNPVHPMLIPFAPPPSHPSVTLPSPTLTNESFHLLGRNPRYIGEKWVKSVVLVKTCEVQDDSRELCIITLYFLSHPEAENRT